MIIYHWDIYSIYHLDFSFISQFHGSNPRLTIINIPRSRLQHGEPGSSASGEPGASRPRLRVVRNAKCLKRWKWRIYSRFMGFVYGFYVLWWGFMGFSWDYHGDSANQKLSRLNNLALWGGQLGGSLAEYPQSSGSLNNANQEGLWMILSIFSDKPIPSSKLT